MTKLTKESIKVRMTVSDSGCWLWNGTKKTCRRNTHKYGWVTFQGKQMSAHRASWILFNGEIERGFVVCHKCDVPECINPEHLFIGTQKDNVKDMIAKGRKWIGIAIRKIDGKPNRAKLTESDVVEIHALRNLGMSQSKIAQKIGVSQGCISQLLRGVTNYAK